jgi:hypothetical protein
MMGKPKLLISDPMPKGGVQWELGSLGIGQWALVIPQGGYA